MTKSLSAYRTTKLFLCIALAVLFLASLRFGAVSISTDEIISALRKIFASNASFNLNERIFLNLRLPRTLLSVLVGSTLAGSGVCMQGLFRNPIVEPGLIGTSSGAALGAAFYFSAGAMLHWNAAGWMLPLCAFAGALLATLAVLSLSRSAESGNRSIIILLITGIAVNALCQSGIGFLSFIARDPQARSITFWNLGTLSGANWYCVGMVGISTTIGSLISFRLAKQLNTLMLGEEEALHLGIRVQQLKQKVLLVNVAMVAIATAFTGVIGFVGLITPHLLRMLHGADNRWLIRNSILAGGVLVCSADLVARLIIRPAELPIGILTSLIGVPVFILLTNVICSTYFVFGCRKSIIDGCQYRLFTRKNQPYSWPEWCREINLDKNYFRAIKSR